MAISEKKMKIVIDNYFKSECDVNTSIREAFEKGFRIGVKKASAEEHKRGKWIEHHEPYTWMGYTYWTCSECGFGEDDNKVRSNYCPNCGADMRGEQDG